MEHLGGVAWILAAAVGLLGGCGDDETSTSPSPDTLVVYERSGGVAGVVEQLRVEGDGRAVLLSGPEQERATFDLSPDELDRLRSELEAAAFSVTEDVPDGGCADCFEYRVEYGDESVDFIEIEKPAESLVPVLDHLGALVAEHTPPP